MGNDLAGGKGTPLLEIIQTPCEINEFVDRTFPSCAITRAQVKQFSDVVDLSDSFLVPDRKIIVKSDSLSTRTQSLVKFGDLFNLPLTREQPVMAQKQDASLQKCIVAAQSQSGETGQCVLKDEVLFRKWCLRTDSENDWDTVFQVVVPQPFWATVLSIAHDGPCAAHLGVSTGKVRRNGLLPRMPHMSACR